MLKLIQLEASTACNAHCKICPRDQMTRQKGQMSDVLFRKIVADGMDMGIVQFLIFLYGEPLAFPKLFDWLDYLQERGLVSTIFTNGALLTEESAVKLGSYTNLTDIIVSFHGATKETYEKMMGLPFESTKAKVEHLFQVSHAPVRVYMVDCPETRNEIGLFHGMWKDRSHFIGSYFNYSGLKEGANPGRNPHHCEWIMSQVAILWDGRVVRCCFDYDGSTILGDINKESLREIWERDQISRDKHQRLEFEGICRNCNYNKL